MSSRFALLALLGGCGPLWEAGTPGPMPDASSPDAMRGTGRAWEPAVPISDTDVDAEHPVVAHASDGAITAAWVQLESQPEVFAARADNEVWEEPLRLPFGAGIASVPQLDVAATRDVVAVWQRNNGAREAVRASWYDLDTGWNTGAVLFASSATDALAPRVATNNLGATGVAWTNDDGVDAEVWAVRGDPTTWGTASRIDADAAGTARAPDVTVDQLGAALVIWQQADGVWASRSGPGDIWPTPVRVSAPAATGVSSPRLSGDLNGNATATWTESNGMITTVVVARYAITGGWSAPLTLAPTGSNPDVHVGEGGEACVVWEADTGWIFATRSIPLGAWSDPERISGFPDGSRTPQVVVDGLGATIVAWSQFEGEIESVWAVMAEPDGAWSEGEPLELDDTHETRHPQLAVSYSNEAVAIWAQSDGTDRRIWTARYR